MVKDAMEPSMAMPVNATIMLEIWCYNYSIY